MKFTKHIKQLDIVWEDMPCDVLFHQMCLTKRKEKQNFLKDKQPEQFILQNYKSSYKRDIYTED